MLKRSWHQEEDEQRGKRRREEELGEDESAGPEPGVEGVAAARQRSKPASEPEPEPAAAPPAPAAAEAAQEAEATAAQADGTGASGGDAPTPLPDNHHLPRGLRWDEFQRYFRGQPAAVTLDRWDIYLENAEKVAIRGVPLPPGATGNYWAGQRVLVEELGERGTITKASHGFFIVQMDSREKSGEKREAIKKRGYELLIADDEDRIRLGQVSDDADEVRRAPPRPQPRKPAGVDIADRLWSQKENGIEWKRRARPRPRWESPETACEIAVSKIVIDSWGTQWHSETGMPHTATYSARPSAPPPPRWENPAPPSQPSRPPVLLQLSVKPQTVAVAISAVSAVSEGAPLPVAPGAAYKCEKGKLYLVNGQKRISDGKAWRCEHYRQPSQCQFCGGAGVCEHNRRRSACLECNKDNPESHLWRQQPRART